MPTLTDPQRAFLAEPLAASVTTVRGDGGLHTTVVWVDADADDVLFCTVRGRAKERHLTRDPRVSLLVVDPANAYRWLAVSGSAEVSEEGVDAHLDRLSQKYLGQEVFPWRRPDEQWVVVRIRASRIETTGIG